MNIRGEENCCYRCVAPKRHVGCHIDCPDWAKQQEKIATYEKNDPHNEEVGIYYRNKQYKNERGINAKRWKIRGKL